MSFLIISYYFCDFCLFFYPGIHSNSPLLLISANLWRHLPQFKRRRSNQTKEEFTSETDALSSGLLLLWDTQQRPQQGMVGILLTRLKPVILAMLEVLRHCENVFERMLDVGCMRNGVNPGLNAHVCLLPPCGTQYKLYGFLLFLL